MSNNLTSPSLIGVMRESPLYRVMGTGLTSPIMIIGHADALTMDQPYKVINMQEAVNFLQADSSSPLLRAMLELYNAGCKDIWLYPVAPMSEYEPTVSNRLIANDEWGGLNFYQLYYQRLASAYSVLRDYDTFELISPLEAPHFYSGDVDFTTQLINFCGDNYENTSHAVLGVLGTRISELNAQTVEQIIADERLTNASSYGKFVSVFMGEAIITQPQISTSYSAPISTQILALLSTTSLARSISGLKLPNAASLVGLDLSKEQIASLAEARINVCSRSIKAKRGQSYELRVLTDNTLADTNSDFWTLSQMRITAKCLNQIRYYGYVFIGTLDYTKFEGVVTDYMRTLLKNGLIRDYTLSITPKNFGQKVEVNVGITPLYGLRNIYFTIETGPGE